MDSAMTFKRITAGTYAAEFNGHTITVDRNEGINEWSLRIDGEWVDYYPTKRDAINEITRAIA